MFVAQFRFKTFVQRLMCHLQEIRDFSAEHPVRELRKRAVRDTVDYVESHMGDAIGVYSAREVFDIALGRTEGEGHYLEFGVYRGGSARYIANKRPNVTLHGFDSFEGLPEGWSGTDMAKGTFALGGKLPKVPGNVRLHPGWFDKSLPAWAAANPGTVRFVHIDCDLYSSTKTVFDLIGDRFVPGTVIVFDEYFGYPNWRKHEFKAFQELVQQRAITYEYVAFSKISVAVLIKDIGK
jgi:predicted O-methyltransferase YrrM